LVEANLKNLTGVIVYDSHIDAFDFTSKKIISNKFLHNRKPELFCPTGLESSEREYAAKPPSGFMCTKGIWPDS
jgi:hypothetical protein